MPTEEKRKNTFKCICGPVGGTETSWRSSQGWWLVSGPPTSSAAHRRRCRGRGVVTSHVHKIFEGGHGEYKEMAQNGMTGAR